MANHQSFEAIRIVGGLLGSKVLQDVRRYQLAGQSSEDYGIEPGLTFNDEIGRYWRIARARWKEYQSQCQREDISSHKLAREEWLLPLLSRVLGYRVEPSTRKTIGEREFPLTHTAADGAIPLVLCGADFDLDKGDVLFGQEGRKRSPMGLVQEYLNAENACLWGIVSNGITLRLLRDNPAMTRPAYIEIDFARLFDEDNYADFATLWLLLHASRLAPRNNQVEQCYLEQWREKGQDEGERALDNLRYGVAEALRQLGTGFVAHKENAELREALTNGELSVDEYFQQVLRLVYRFLFLLTAEDRDIALLPNDYKGQDYRIARKLYQQGYSVTQLRERARQNRHYDQHGDAWQQLLVTFKGYAEGQPVLAQPALGGLFATDQCAALESCQLENRYLFSALFNLSYFQHHGTLSRINYRDMDTEEFGSVYESLLELIPQLNTEGKWQFSFIGDAEDEKSASGHSRKLTGSYYTPDSLVQELIKSALEPVIADRLKVNPQQPRDAILSITVCDPACGSGHFLLAAARRLAAELAQIDAGTDQATEQHYRHALRDVVRHCIYGVDLNPMAVELCKTGLWLESIEPGKPLSFLASHIQCGNSLCGVLELSDYEQGIPKEAYKSLIGDDRDVTKHVLASNKAGLSSVQFSLFENQNNHVQQEETTSFFDLPEDSIDQIVAKKNAWHEYLSNPTYRSERRKEDALLAAFFMEKTFNNLSFIPTNETIAKISDGVKIPAELEKKVFECCYENRVFHWKINFPKIFSENNQGFDVVLGNPPWDVSQFSEEEYFSSIAPSIAKLKGAKRRQEISKLEQTNPPIWNAFVSRKREVEAFNNYIRGSGRFVLSAKGKLNLYALFTELGAQLISKNGRVGLVVQSGLATDDSTKDLFYSLHSSNKLVSFYEFENAGFFKGAGKGHMVRFALVTIAGSPGDWKAKFMFQGKSTAELNNEFRLFNLTLDDLKKINPNSLNCPIFMTEMDARLAKKMYSNVFVNESEPVEGNPWQVSFSQGIFNSSSDSDLFCELKELEDKDFELRGNTFFSEFEVYYPLYEAKMAYLYNHRHGDFSDISRDKRPHKLPTIDNSRLNNPNYQVQPYYWINELEVAGKVNPNWKFDWLLGWRDVTDARASVRTTVACVIPKTGVTHSFSLMYLKDCFSVELIVCLYANLCSLPFDYCARQKVGGLHLTFNLIKQLPVLKPQTYVDQNIRFIKSRVLELTYTANDLKAFAEDVGYHGEPFAFDAERRHQLKCELDAYYAKLYGLTREELRYILDPTDVMGEDYPSETFRVLKNKELKEFGEYRTQRLVLEAWDKLLRGELQ